MSPPRSYNYIVTEEHYSKNNFYWQYRFICSFLFFTSYFSTDEISWQILLDNYNLLIIHNFITEKRKPYYMAVHLIIDGYNLIRQSPYMQELDLRDLELGREALLAALSAYRQARPQHRITVVFDGWEKGGLKESRDRRGGLAVVFSRRGERADEVIKRLLAQERSRGVVVSSDRELQDYADQVGAAWISAPQFEISHLRGAVDGQPEPDEEAPAPPGTQKKGPSHRAPKRQRQRQQRLKKL
jgi:predicted RNA-binding protein with PIN domain